MLSSWLQYENSPSPSNQFWRILFTLKGRTYQFNRLHSVCAQQEGRGSITKVVRTFGFLVYGEENSPLGPALTMVMNMIPDKESRTWSNRLEWKLSPILFQKINCLLRPLSLGPACKQGIVTVSAVCELKAEPPGSSHKCNWNTLPGKSFTIPPWSLIGRILSVVHSQGVQELVLVAPAWRVQAWYPMLFQMLVRIPILICRLLDKIQSVCLSNLPDIIPQLAMCVIPANNVR